MIIYSVTVTIKKEVEEEWLKWMKDVHIKDVMKTGYFTDWQIYKQNIPENSPVETTYLINYFSESFTKYEEYVNKEAPRLQKEHIERFPGKSKSARSVYTLLE